VYANERAFRLLSVAGEQVKGRFRKLKDVLAASLVDEQVLAATNKDERAGRAQQYLTNVAGYKRDEISVEEAHSACDAGWARQGPPQGTLSLTVDTQSDLAFRAEFHGEPKDTCFLKAIVRPGLELRDRLHRFTGDYFDDIVVATYAGDTLLEFNLAGLQIKN